MSANSNWETSPKSQSENRNFNKSISRSPKFQKENDQEKPRTKLGNLKFSNDLESNSENEKEGINIQFSSYGKF